MPTLASCLQTYLAIERRPRTNRQYRYILERMVAAIGPERDVALVSDADLLDYFQRQRDAGKTPATLFSYTSITKAFFNWCVEEHLLSQPPTRLLRRRKPQRTDEVRAIPRQELQKMVAYARLTHPRNYALLAFMISTGCRVGGLVSLRRSRLHLDSRRPYAILIEKGGERFKARFGMKTAAILRTWLDQRPPADHDYVWTGLPPRYAPLTTGAVTAILHRLSVVTAASRKWGPHSIRHAVGRDWNKRKISPKFIQQKLGHRSLLITLDFYSDDDDYLDELSETLDLALLDPETPAAAPALTVIRRAGG